jgi:hypothetical protein
MDVYDEELAARITTELREQLHRGRAAGAPHPVALCVWPADEQGRAILAHLGFNDLQPTDPAPLKVCLPGIVANLFDKHISPGLGKTVLGIPLYPREAFRLIAVRPGLLIDWHSILFRDKETARLSSVTIDVKRRMVKIHHRDKDEPERPLTW